LAISPVDSGVQQWQYSEVAIQSPHNEYIELMRFQLNKLMHASLLVADIDASLRFYCELLGLQLDPNRPDLGYPGAWLNIGDGQQIHLLQLPNPDPVKPRPLHGGRDRHLAFKVSHLALLIEALDSNHIPYSQSKSGRPAIFFRDPDGNALECVEQAPH